MLLPGWRRGRWLQSREVTVPVLLIIADLWISPAFLQSEGCQTCSRVTSASKAASEGAARILPAGRAAGSIRVPALISSGTMVK